MALPQWGLNSYRATQHHVCTSTVYGAIFQLGRAFWTEGHLNIDLSFTTQKVLLVHELYDNLS